MEYTLLVKRKTPQSVCSEVYRNMFFSTELLLMYDAERLQIKSRPPKLKTCPFQKSLHNWCIFMSHINHSESEDKRKLTMFKNKQLSHTSFMKCQKPQFSAMSFKYPFTLYIVAGFLTTVKGINIGDTNSTNLCLTEPQQERARITAS